ncbi:MAG: thioesterase family protein [Myxococcota bacterium]
MTAPQSFDEASRLERIGDTTFRAVVPDGWQQGRGAFGGLVVGLGLRALEALQVDPTRRLRSASAEIPSPVMTGPLDLEVTVLRRGRGVDALEVHLRQGGEVRARVTAIFGKARAVDVAAQPEPPALASMPMPEPLPMPPPFAAHFELRSTGPLPFSGAGKGYCEGWVKPRVAFAAVGAPEIACLCDVYWPSFFSQVTSVRPAATIGYTLQTTPHAFEASSEDLFFFRSRQLYAGDGFSHELRELWNRDGQLVALNPQTFAIIK